MYYIHLTIELNIKYHVSFSTKNNSCISHFLYIIHQHLLERDITSRNYPAVSQRYD